MCVCIHTHTHIHIYHVYVYMVKVIEVGRVILGKVLEYIESLRENCGQLYLKEGYRRRFHKDT